MPRGIFSRPNPHGQPQATTITHAPSPCSYASTSSPSPCCGAMSSSASITPRSSISPPGPVAIPRSSRSRANAEPSMGLKQSPTNMAGSPRQGPATSSQALKTGCCKSHRFPQSAGSRRAHPTGVGRAQMSPIALAPGLIGRTNGGAATSGRAQPFAHGVIRKNALNSKDGHSVEAATRLARRNKLNLTGTSEP